MNINKEVERYEAKKNKLLGGLINRLTAYSSEKDRAVGRINDTIKDLQVQKEADIAEIQNVALQLNKLTK